MPLLQEEMLIRRGDSGKKTMMFRLLPIALLAAALALAAGPKETVRLFNGKDSDGLYPWLKRTGKEDPQRSSGWRTG